MYATSDKVTPDPKKIPAWMQNYESSGGVTDGAVPQENLLGSRAQPGPELTKRKAGRL